MEAKELSLEEMSQITAGASGKTQVRCERCGTLLQSYEIRLGMRMCEACRGGQQNGPQARIHA